MVWIKAVLTAALLVGVVQSIQFPGWKPKKTYFFQIEGKTVTGLPQIREQFSGFEYNGTLLLETHAPNVLLLKFIDMEYDIMNGDLPNGWWSDSSASSYNETKPLPLTKSTIVVQLENHFVKQVVVPHDLKDWELNFIKGFVKSFFPNFDSRKNNKDKSSLSSKSESRLDVENSFTVMEETVVGKCEVQYEVFITPRNGEGWQSWNHNMKKSACDNNGDVYEIVRTHNYSNCEYSAETRFALPRFTIAQCPLGESRCDKVWNRASVSRIRGCTSQNGFLILDSVTSSSVSANLQLHGESKAIVSSKLSATLVDPSTVSTSSTVDINARVTLPKNPVHIQDFFYTYSLPDKSRSGGNCKSNRSAEKQFKPKNNSSENPDFNNYDSEKEFDFGTAKKSSPSSANRNSTGNDNNFSRNMNENLEDVDAHSRVRRNDIDEEMQRIKKKNVLRKSSSEENQGSDDNVRYSHDFDYEDDVNQWNKKNGSRKSSKGENRGMDDHDNNSNEFDDENNGNQWNKKNGSRKSSRGKNLGSNENDNNSNEFDNENNGNQWNKKNGSRKSSRGENRGTYDKDNNSNESDNENDGNQKNKKNGSRKSSRGENRGSDNNDDDNSNAFNNEDNGADDDNDNRNKKFENRFKNNRDFIENENNNVANKRNPKNKVVDEDKTSGKSIKTAWNLHEPSMHERYAQPLNPFTLSFKSDESDMCVEELLEDQVRAVARDIMAGSVSSEGALTEKFAIAIDIGRMLSFDELKSLSNVFMNSENLFERIVFRDVVSSTGSKPSLKMLSEWIENDQLSSDEAAQILSLLPEKLIFSDKETIEFYFKIVKKVAAKGDSSMFSAAVIGFSNFVRVACSDKKSMETRFNPEFYNEVCQESQIDEFIQWLDQRLKDDSSSFRVISAAIGNTGGRSAIRLLMKKASDSNLSSYKRLSSVFALKYQSFYHPKVVAPHLLRLYANFSNPAPVRIAAFSLLVYTHPSVSMWQRFAVSTWFEKNIVVNNFVQTTIQSFAKSEYQTYADISKAASIVVPLMKPIDNMMQMKAFNSMKTSTIREIETAVFSQGSWIGLADVMSLYNRHTTSTNAFPSLLEAELTSANPDGLLTAIKDFLMLSSDVSQARPPIANLKRSTRWIHNLLGLVARKPPQLEGDIHIKINRLVEHIYSFDRKTQISMVKWGRRMMTQLLLGKLQYDHLKLDMSSTMVSTTTELGLPIRLQMRVPSIMQFNASARLLQNNALNTSIEFLHSSGMNTDLSFFTPWDRNTFTAGVIGSCFFQIPTVAVLHRRANKSQFVEVSSNAFEKSKIFHHSTLPFTSLRKPEFITKAYRRNTETRLVHSGVKKEKTFDLTPEINLRYRTEGEMMSMARAIKNIQVMGQPFLRHHSMKVTQIDVTVDELPPISFNMSFGHALKRNGEVEIHYTNEDYTNHDSNNGGPTSTVSPVTTTSKPVTLEISEAKTTTTESTLLDELTKAGKSSSGNADDKESNSNSTNVNGSTTETYHSTTTVAPSSANDNQESRGFFQSVKDFFKNIFGSSKKNDVVPRRVYYSSRPQKTLNSSDMEIHSLIYSVDGNTFNASSMNIFNGKEDPSDLLLMKVMEGLSSGSASVVNMDVVLKRSGVFEKYSTYLTLGTSSMKRVKRLGVFFRSSAASSMQGGLTSTLALPLLPAYDLETIVHEKKRPKFYVDFINQYESNKIRQLSIQGDMTYKAYNMENSDIINECQKPKSIADHKCRKRYEEGTSIEKYSLNMSADDKSGMIQWLLHKTITAGAAIITGNEQYELVDDRSQPESNSLQLDVVVDKEKKTLNSRITMESAEVLLKKIPFPYVNEPSIAMTLYTEMEQQFNSDYCGISYSGISTFDRVKVDYNLTKCWHLATKDCSGKSRIAVLTKRSQNDLDLDLEINLDNYKVIDIIDGSIRINEKNVTISRGKSGAAISDEAGAELIRVERSLDYGLFINLPAHGFHVIYTNTSAVIHASSKMQNRLCGLCGDFNSEEFGEFTTPKGTRARDSQQFGASYRIKDTDCLSEK
uniref:Vitellogenin 1 n=1 Tax=Sogatella furcifera TaxID=113103 RepID=A0A8E4ANG9_SOGFU|nr:vitellogenin 1 [Sogatella furcifera]